MSLTKHELKSTLVVSLIFSLRLMGLFILLPIFSIYASEYNNSSAFLAGIAIGSILAILSFALVIFVYEKSLPKPDSIAAPTEEELSAVSKVIAENIGGEE